MDTKVNEASPPETWCILELMGHVKLAGRLSEEERFGVKMGRLDIPTEVTCPHCNGANLGRDCNTTCGMCVCGLVAGSVTQYFGGSSVYRITLVTEAVARHIARSNAPAPVSPWDFPKQLPAAEPSTRGFDNYDDRDEDVYDPDDAPI